MQVLKIAAVKHICPVMLTEVIAKIATQDPAKRNFRPLDGQWRFTKGLKINTRWALHVQVG